MAPPTDWQRWFDEHAAGLLLAARLWTRGGADAEDAVQEAFVRAWRRRDVIENLPAYLYAATKSAALDLARARQRAQRRDQQVGGPSQRQPWFEPPTLAGAEAGERRRAIEAALEQLPPEQREVVVMKIWGGLTFEGIAAALEIPANTAASRYRYALDRLRGVLALEHQP